MKNVGGSREELVARVAVLEAANTALATALTTVALTASGDVILSGLPTSDPAVAGQLWSNSNILTVSAG